MPRDKTQTHERIISAARKEFLEKGYEQSSLKTIANSVGITSAALYRHYTNKLDLFASFVCHAVASLHTTPSILHFKTEEEVISDSRALTILFDTTYADAKFVLNVLYEYPEEFYLLFFCSGGTVYSLYLEDILLRSTDAMMSFLESCRKRGISTKDVSKKEVYMLIRAYSEALLQPIKLRMEKQDAERYLKTVMDFYTPGWRLITGL